MNDLIKFYPVGNGDQSLIILKDGTTIMVDCNIRQDSVGSTDASIYDVKKDILNCIKRSDNVPYVDVFILTHGDQDHCRGFKINFYQGDPKKYSEADKKNNLIRVDAMWFSPMIAEEHKNDDEEAYQKEAERRLALHRKKDSSKDDAGNRIRIIGYDGNTDYKDLDHLRSIPGDIVNRFNDRDQEIFSIFIHSPFKKHLTSETPDKKNSTSIVFQARFKEKKADTKFIMLTMFAGDSEHSVWKTILEETKKSGKDKTENALHWDILLAPHHCSWSFFNDRPQEHNPEPKATSLEFLDYKRIGGKVIASSKKIVDDDDNPPHYEAKEEYIKRLDKSSDFLNTDVEPKESAPEPIIFEISLNGGNILESANESKKLAAAISVASSAIIKKPWCK